MCATSPGNDSGCWPQRETLSPLSLKRQINSLTLLVNMPLGLETSTYLETLTCNCLVLLLRIAKYKNRAVLSSSALGNMLI